MILIDDVEVKFGKFPNNEGNLNYNNISFHTHSNITLKYESDQDLLNLFILKKYMDDVIVNNGYTLTILYMPYSRMDRQNDFFTFNLKYVADLINRMKFNRVYVYDAHSEVTLALLDRCVSLSSIPVLFRKFMDWERTEDLHILFPDAGAEKRFNKSFAYPSLVGMKTRNFEDGSITSYNVFGDIKEGATVVIVDDLCAKGGTFIGAAEALKKLGAGKIFLIVGHCENIVFEGQIFKTDLIERVYTTNSILNDDVERDHRLYIHKLYEKKNKKEN